MDPSLVRRAALCRPCARRKVEHTLLARVERSSTMALGKGTEMKLSTLAAFVLICMSGFAVAQQASDGLQFNVPYICNDGKVYVVHRCEKWPKFEACFYQHEPDSERYNTRAAVVYQMTKM